MKTTDAFLQCFNEAEDKTEGEEDFKGKTILHSNSFLFCIGSLVRETMQIEKCIKDIVRSENPSRKVDFNDLYHKIDLSNAT
ncbi:hypothetical protein OSB04_001101 [Centaurea solstitialis]|uniref:Uncharacterized protein n=1 Tax=Centaurea solstitialis TaxID=347529 RepID=A0AA38U240_9ASTR|nr:hypothetical protein OSB04_001101 [Centaurea solstitialis]